MTLKGLNCVLLSVKNKMTFELISYDLSNISTEYFRIDKRIMKGGRATK